MDEGYSLMFLSCRYDYVCKSTKMGQLVFGELQKWNILTCF